ncbi:MAG: prohibitin family protein [Oscillatoria princeps RMCB-10]|jgi:regulator of protease activity HflC (stomatin/prohibitin superfamily)|nr:prohibitin family protein [Oscillatoria princeps RMCB-10]
MSFLLSLLTALISIFIFLNAERVEDDRSRLAVRAIAALIGAVAVLSSLFRTLIVIPAGNVGVVDSLGKVSEPPLNPGVHLVNPAARIVNFSTRLKNVQETIEATSKEGLAFNINVSLQYRLQPQKAVSVYENLGTDETEIVLPRFRSIVREVTANYPAEAIYSTKRQEIASRLRRQLSEQLAPLGFTVEETLLRELQIPERIQAAIQEKLKAEQESQQMAFTIKKERQEAERKRIEAKGISDYQKMVSQGLNAQVLQLKAIEATEKLAQSPNAKVLIVGGGQRGVPVIFQVDNAPSEPAR